MYYAFRYCENLETVNFNAKNCELVLYIDGENEPESGIFLDCYNLKEINIGKNVKNVPDELRINGVKIN